jgi:SOS-response transcriptional repressor LexA
MFMVAPCGAFDHETEPMSIASTKPLFTDKQGQYLAFIHTYVLLHRRPPAEADMERYFGVTPPSVHRMVVELEKRGLIRRLPRQPRSIALCIPADKIPQLRPQPIETSVSRY